MTPQAHTSSHKEKGLPPTSPMSNQKGKLTQGRIVLLRELNNAEGPVSFSVLRKGYFGEDRAKANATTAFYMALQRVISFGWIEKLADGGYQLTPTGKEIIEAEVKRDPTGVKNAKSLAAERFAQ